MFSKHKNISFTVEHGNIDSLSFLDVKICLKNSKFVASVYRKPTVWEVVIIYESFIPIYQKRGLLCTLFHSNFSVCCDFRAISVGNTSFEDYPQEKQSSSKFH